MPDLLEPRDRKVIKVLLEFLGESNSIRYKTLRKAGFPEKLAEALENKSEYLDSLASREFQNLKKKGWLRLDGTGLIELVRRP